MRAPASRRYGRSGVARPCSPRRWSRISFLPARIAAGAASAWLRSGRRTAESRDPPPHRRRRPRPVRSSGANGDRSAGCARSERRTPGLLPAAGHGGRQTTSATPSGRAGCDAKRLSISAAARATACPRCRSPGRPPPASGAVSAASARCRPPPARPAPAGGAAASRCSGAAARSRRRRRTPARAAALVQTQPLQRGQHGRGVEPAAPRVEPDGDGAVAPADHLLDQGERRIVHRLVAKILEHPQDGGPSCAG